jgi:hypothetical protein
MTVVKQSQVASVTMALQAPQCCFLYKGRRNEFKRVFFLLKLHLNSSLNFLPAYYLMDAAGRLKNRSVCPLLIPFIPHQSAMKTELQALNVCLSSSSSWR